jgi:proteic killer suppression protein
MIKSFKDRETQKVFEGHYSSKIPQNLTSSAERRLRILHRASSLDDLRIPPGNRLEAMKGNRKGQWSIRINNQFRLCFVWADKDAHEVEIVDYH